MNDKTRVQELFAELRNFPDRFDSTGKALALLQEYFRGLPIDSLRPFLKHENVSARRSTAFIVSELGTNAMDLLSDIAPLTIDPDLHIQWYSIESVAICSAYRESGQFINVIRAVDSESESISRLAMRMVSNANDLQLQESRKVIGALISNQELHKYGIDLLLKGKSVMQSELIQFLDADDNLLRKYGAIAANRSSAESPDSLVIASSNRYEVVSRFANEELRKRVSRKR